MCNLFHLSSKIAPIYHVIILLYHPHFGSYGQNPTIKYHQDDISFRQDIKSLHDPISDDAKL